MGDCHKNRAKFNGIFVGFVHWDELSVPFNYRFNYF